MTVSLKHSFNSAVADGSTSWTGTITSGTNTITSVSPTPTSAIVGYRLYHASIPSGTTVSSVSGSTITMSANATGSATGATFYTDDKLVQASDWNAEHTLTLDTGKLLGRSSAGTGAAEEISIGSGLSLSGNTLSNSQSTTLTVGTTATSGGAAGQIMFDTGSVLQESSNLTWDNTNNVLRLVGATKTGVTLSGVQITGTAGQFSCNAASAPLTVGMLLTISGTFGGTGSISGYANPTTYVISATNGSTTFTLIPFPNGSSPGLTTTAGTPTGLTYSYDPYPVQNLTQTWNNSATSFAGLRFNVTDTASNATSLFMDLQVAGVSRFKIDKGGRIYTQDSTAVYGGGLGMNGLYPALYGVANNVAVDWTSNGQFFSVAGTFGIGRSTATVDLFLSRRGAANLRLGAADAAAPVAQTLSVQSVVAGTSNTAGANFTITGSQGTGTGAGGSIIFQVAPAGLSGTAQNALVTKMTLASNGNLQLTNSIDIGFDIYAGRYITLGSGLLSTIYSGASGVIQLSSGASIGNGFNRLQFGGATSSFPALKRSSTILQVRLADDSGYTTMDAQHRLQGTAPASATATGTAGDIRYDADYIYICTATDTWKRVAIATWP